MKKYYEQLYVHTFNNLIKMSQLIERQNLQKFTLEDIDNLNRSISIKDTESTINNLPNSKRQNTMLIWVY